MNVSGAQRSVAASVLAGVCFSLATNVSAADDEARFQKQILPILTERCFQCHSHEADKIKGGLVVDSLSGLLAGGDSGPALVPGEPEKSLLIKAIRYADENLQMPPKGKKLPPSEIAALTEWVKAGAKWPGAKTSARPPGKITDADRAYWFFQPLQSTPAPAVKNTSWPRNELDHFILARLEREGLRPSPEADRRTLMRRAYFDLTGLPPTPTEMDAFLKDTSPDAYEKLIDRLLASPRYGERWVRHWLDLARYAESDGYRVDDFRPHAWRYRDYVIRAFNDDKPFDRFVLEQLAGDEIAPHDPDALAATGFLRLWIYEYNNRDAFGQWQTILNDMTDTTGELFLGLGFQCARCHDHKFDPILQKDYYSLQAFFAPFMPKDDVTLATPAERADHQARLAAWEARTADLRKRLDDLERPHLYKAATQAVSKLPDEVQALINKPAADRTPYEHQVAELAYRQVTYQWERLGNALKGDDKEQWLALKKQLAEFDDLKPKPLPVTCGVTDVGNLPPPTLMPKGKGEAPPALPTVLGEPTPAIETPPPAPNSTGRRSALARWITRPDNALTTRVIANRLWQYHFGRGLVGTSSDFGTLGEKPSHPELLDWLAREFVRQGWSFKKMHRLILLSATYRQSGANYELRFTNDESRNSERLVNRTSEIVNALDTAQRLDPENRLLWRMSSRRLDAEQIRDALYAASGELSLDAGGPSVDVAKPRRTIYTKAMRNTRDPLLDAFDLPEGFVSTAQRNVTTTASQSLLLINSQSLILRAKAMAARLKMEVPGDDAQLVTAAHRLALQRNPSPDEIESGVKFLQAQMKHIDVDKATQPLLLADRMPAREGRAAVFQPRGVQESFEVPDSEEFLFGDFTIEAFALLKSIYDGDEIRTIASHWNGKPSSPGWSLGVTGRKSQRKPQTLVLLLAGEAAVASGVPPDVEGARLAARPGVANSERVELSDAPAAGRDATAPRQAGRPPLQAQPIFSAIFSDFTLALNKPYFLAAVVVSGSGTNDLSVTFYAKDISNDDEPVQIARVPHRIASRGRPEAPLRIGSRDGRGGHQWDGLIDDVRLSAAALRQDQLLLTTDNPMACTMGFWQFEPKPNAYFDSTPRGHHIRPRAPESVKMPADAHTLALADLCQALLNSNEFLYVD